MHRSNRTSFVRSLKRLVRAALFCLPFIGPLGAESAQAANGSVTYTYDALGRVKSVSYDTGVIILYAYDANGNRTQQVINVNTTVLHWATPVIPCTSNCWGAAVWG